MVPEKLHTGVPVEGLLTLASVPELSSGLDHLLEMFRHTKLTKFGIKRATCSDHETTWGSKLLALGLESIRRTLASALSK